LTGSIFDDRDNRMSPSHIRKGATRHRYYFSDAAPSVDARGCAAPAPSPAHGTVISLLWSAPAFLSVKGVLHQPDVKPTLKPETRDAILLAIAKARCWIDDLASGRVRYFAGIAQCLRWGR
jgi:hypothetical protein